MPSDQSRMVRCRVLVGDSVYEDAAVTLRDGILWVEFDADDMEDLAIPLAELLERPEASKSA